MLTKFLNSIDEFNIQLKKTESTLVNHKDINSRHEGWHHILRHRLIYLGQDIINLSELFLNAHINATAWTTDSTHEVWSTDSTHKKTENPQSAHEVNFDPKNSLSRLKNLSKRQKGRPGKLEEKSLNELKVIYKSYFFFIRAFLDTAYGVIQILHKVDKSVISPRIYDCIKGKKEPIFTQLNSIDGFIEWFGNFREKRNQIKDGANFFIVGPPTDVGIGFTRVTSENSLVLSWEKNDHVRISDLIKAFKMITHITYLIEMTINNKSRNDA